MSSPDRYLEGGRVVGSGSFKLDRSRAMDKLARFQLAEPHQYVLELVAAAVCAGASQVRVRTDADDLELSWDGDHPSRDELDDLFDYIFVSEPDPRSRMLRHLAQGVYGALGLEPRWIRVERPGLTWDFAQPTQVVTTPNERTEGVRVHVRERVGWAVVSDALSPFRGPRESRELRGRAWACPIPILLGDQPISGAPSHWPTPPDGRQVSTGPSHRLWLTRARSTWTGVQLVRDGIQVDAMWVSAGPLGVAGWLEASELSLDASRSAARHDEAWAAVSASLHQQLVVLVAGEHEQPRPWLSEQARYQAVRELLEQDLGHDQLAHVPAFQDLLGRQLSLDQLRAGPVIYLLDDAGLADPSDPAPQFAVERSPGQQLVDPDGGRLQPGDLLFIRRQRGREARRRAAARVTPLSHGDAALLERSFDDEGIQGTVALLREPAGTSLLWVELRVDGLPVTSVPLPFPAPLSARVVSGALRAEEDFEDVVRDAAYEEVMARVDREVLELVCLAAERLPDQASVRALVVGFLRTVRLDEAAREQADLDGAIPPAVLRAPLFPDLSGRYHSVDDLRGGRAGNAEVLSEPLTWVPSTHPTQLALPDVFRLDEPDREAIHRVLPRKLVDATEELSARERAQRRRRGPRHEARVRGRVDACAPLSRGGLSGQVGLRSDPVVGLQLEVVPSAPADECLLDVVHQGVLLCTIAVPGVPARTCAALDLPEARPAPTWDGVRNEAALVERVRPILGEALLELIAAQAPAVAGDRWLPLWLVELLRLHPDLPEALQDLPLFPTSGGDVLSWAQVGELPRIWWLEHPARVRGLEDALVLDGSRRRALAGRAELLEDARPLLAELVDARRQFTERPRRDLELPGALRCARVTSLPGGTAMAGVIDQEHAAPGLTIHYWFEGRPLCAQTLVFPVPVAACLAHPDIRPNSRYTSLDPSVDPEPLHALAQQVARLAVIRVLMRPEGRFAPLHVVRVVREPGRVEWIDEPLAAVARAAPRFQMVDGGRASVDQVVAWHGSGLLLTVPARLAGVATPEDDRRWLVAGDLERTLLTWLLGGPPPDGAGELDTWLCGQARRRQLLPTPFVPVEPWVVAEGSYREDTRRYWLALGENKDSLRVSWHAEGRVVKTREYPFPASVRAVVGADELRGDEAFAEPIPAALAKQLLAEVEELIPRFLLEVARALQPASPEVTHLRVVPGDVVLAALVRWAAKERKLPAEWGQLPLLLCSTGERTTLPVLLKAARGKKVRVVPPATDPGRPLDPERPVLVVREAGALWLALERYFDLQDYSDELAREEQAWRRREAPPERREPEAAAVLTQAAPTGREGFVQVLASGAVGVTLHQGWRPLDTVTIADPVPLVGHVSDDALQPDPMFSKATGSSRRKLLTALKRVSREALEQLLSAPEPSAHRGLWLAILRHSHDHPRELLSAPEGGVADLPLFRSGVDGVLTPREVARSTPVRWVPPGAAACSSDPDRPLVEASPLERELLAGVLPGRDAEADIARERAVLQRQGATRAFTLPRARWLAQHEAKTQGYRLLVGLLWKVRAQGRLEIVCQGAFVERRELEWRGVYAVLDLPRSQVDEDWTSARVTKAQRKQIERELPALLERACETLRSEGAPAGLRALLSTVDLRGGRSAWREHDLPPWGTAPLLEGPGGAATLCQAAASARKHGVILWGDEPVEGPLVLRPTRHNRRLLRSVDLHGCCVGVEEWRRATEEERDEEQRQQRADRALRQIRQRGRSLSRDLGVHVPGELLTQAEPLRSHPLWGAALADPEGVASWVLPLLVLDAHLAEVGEPALTAELVERIAEHLGE